MLTLYNCNCRQGIGKGGAWILHVRQRQDSYTLEYGVCESYGTDTAVACLVRLSFKAAAITDTDTISGFLVRKPYRPVRL